MRCEHDMNMREQRTTERAAQMRSVYLQTMCDVRRRVVLRFVRAPVCRLACAPVRICYATCHAIKREWADVFVARASVSACGGGSRPTTP